MAKRRYTRAGDRPRAAGFVEATGNVDLSGFLGRWANTNKNTQCIESFSLIEQDDPVVRALGKNAPEVWGEVEPRPFADSVDSWTDTAFYAVYDFGGIQKILRRITTKASSSLPLMRALTMVPPIELLYARFLLP
jgi:hypothetical protein